MKTTFDYKMETRMSSNTWSELSVLSGQFGYSNVSNFIRAVIDTMIYGATTEEQERLDIALMPFVKQSYKPTEVMKNDFFEYLSQDQYLILTARLGVNEFYHAVIDFEGHSEDALFVQEFVKRYKYSILPRDMRFLLNLYYNDPVQKAKMQEKYAELVRYRTLERQEAAAYAR